jgi:hypothetical protein
MATEGHAGSAGLPIIDGLSYRRSLDEALDALAAALEEQPDIEARLG